MKKSEIKQLIEHVWKKDRWYILGSIAILSLWIILNILLPKSGFLPY
jgi:hypothetical protein